MNDQKIIKYLRSHKRHKAFEQLYKGYPAVEKLILSKGGTKEQAEDIFQEAVIVLYNKVRSNEFELSSKISTYLFAVARFLWKDAQQQAKKQQALSLLDNQLETDQSIVESIEEEKKYKLVEEVLQQIGEKCLTILKLFYYRRKSMKSIAKTMDLRSEKVARNQKYKCLERAKLRLQEIQSRAILTNSQ